MSGLLAIQSVGGVAPNYVFTVTNSAGVLTGDHVVAPLLAGPTHGRVYRVTLVPDGVTINVTDDLVPGGGTYGAPTSGKSGYWTPVTGGMSTGKFNGTPFWGDITERDLLLLEGGLNTSDKSGKLIPGDFAGNPKKATVTFTTAFPNTNYSALALAMTDGSKSFGLATENKTAAGFVVNLHSNNVANLVEVGWYAIVLGE